MEIWKDIEGYNGKYQISNYGNVRSFSKWKNGELLKPALTTTGYYYVHLVKDGRKNTCSARVHRLVADAFIENPNELPEVNHIDGNKLNNRVDNLEWVSRQDNIRHAFEKGLIMPRLGKAHPSSKAVLQKDKSGEVVKMWESVADVYREKGYSTSSIINCCNKRKGYKTAYGYIWEYVK